MGEGDMMTQQQNTIQMSIIDNLLFASTFGCNQFFLQQGNYIIEKKGGNAYKLIISPNQNSEYALMGMINSRVFYSKQPIVLESFYYGLRYYIYIEYLNNLDVDPTGFLIRFYTRKQQIDKYRMLLCIFEANQYNPVVNTDVGKVFSKNILAHTKDNTNPHGQNLQQYNLNVYNQLKLKGSQITIPFFTSYLTGKSECKIDFPQNRQVVFVTAYPESLEAGNIAWKIQDRSVFLTNSGQSNIKVNLKFDMR